MIPRTLTPVLLKAATRYPVVTLTGPRQSGKTTLAKAAFPGHAYVSLEQPDERAFALEDPKGFLARFKGPVILDEVQRVPDLFSYLQGIVDEEDRPGHFILTGSSHFLLLQSISQSLAGRCAVLHLLPLSLAELEGRPSLDLGKLAGKGSSRDLEETLFTGFYPRIHDKGIPPRQWLADYYQTYLERDVRNVLNVRDLEAFSRFVRLCAGRSGQLLNLSGLAADCGISHSAARGWISVLEASFVVTLLRPHFGNLGKRMIKSPKVYFQDTGLLCHLLGIREPAELHTHSCRGGIFEGFVLSELTKNFLHRGETAPLSFWRDSAGHEVDFLVESGKGVLALEAKASRTLAGDSLDGLRYWRGLAKKPSARAALVYGGDEGYVREGVTVLPWSVL